MNLEQHRQLVSTLANQLRATGSKEPATTIETHISSVILADNLAYKIKKPVNLGFLDFSTLEQRHFYCLEELRLNRRLAPEIYLRLLPISGTIYEPQLGTANSPLEYCMQMRRFPEQQTLDLLIDVGRITPDIIDQLCDAITAFQYQLPSAAATDNYGTPETIRHPVVENFAQLTALLSDSTEIAKVSQVRNWSEREYSTHLELFQARKQQGYIREGHGDLHLGNVVLVAGAPVVFDCLEFDPALRWIDLINDLAFLLMDLSAHSRPDLGNRLLNRYLETTGDYPALALLRFYSCYRAMVRAKIAQLTARNGLAAQQDHLQRQYQRYLVQALELTQSGTAQLVLMHGFSGSGKSHISLQLAEQTGAIRVRSDVERKRILGLSASINAAAGPEKGIYSPDTTSRTYVRLLELADLIVGAGYSAIIDATFLQQSVRQQFFELAARRSTAIKILDIKAPATLLEARLAQRQQSGGDASDANLEILKHQLATADPLTNVEQRHTITIRSADRIDYHNLVSELATRLTTSG